jgi:hypothetical protein
MAGATLAHFPLKESVMMVVTIALMPAAVFVAYGQFRVIPI